MRIQPVASPHAIPQNGTPESVRTAKAVAAFNSGKSSYDKAEPAQEHPVANPNQVSVEELSAIQPKVSEVQDNPTPVEATPEPKEERDPALSRQFAQLARQERQQRQKFQQQQQALRAKEAELQAKEQALKTKEVEYSQGYISKDQLKKDTLAILADSGVSWDDLTQQIVNHQPPDPRTDATVRRLEAKIASLEAKQEENAKQATEQQQNQYKAALRQIELDTADLIKGNPVAYEAINKIGRRGVREVVRLIEDTYNKDGVLMTVEQASDEVENYLVEENYNMASSISKIKRRLAEAGQPKANEKKTAESQQTQPGMKTLTNAAASSRKLTAKERAILAFKGELKP
jgi:hypothetical protein